MVQYMNCLGLRQEHGSFWDVSEVIVEHSITVSDSMVFSWSFPNDFFFFSFFRLSGMDSSVSLELAAAERLFSGPSCFFWGAVSVGRMNMVVDYFYCMHGWEEQACLVARSRCQCNLSGKV